MTLSFDAMTTLFLTVITLLFGVYIKQRVFFLQRFCIPSPVVGGFLVSLLLWGCKELGILQINFDTTLQTYLMVAFFTTVGITGSLRLLRLGGKTLIVYLMLVWVVVIFQDALGVGLALLLGIKPVFGIMSGAVALTGGHGNAAAFGSMAESLGVQSATVAAIAAATFGLITGSMSGGPLARWLIRRNQVEVIADENMHVPDVTESILGEIDHVNAQDFTKMMGLVMGIMVIGAYVSKGFTATFGYSLPAYVGAMVMAIIVRNINDVTNAVRLNEKSLSLISDVSLGLFLTMAMMSLKIWELQGIALPLLIILMIQVVCLLAFAAFVVFPILGKTYDAAVMCSGLMGHGLGATPNAMANMSSVCERYSMMSPKAFMIVPLCGAVLLDIVSIPLNTYLINFFANW